MKFRIAKRIGSYDAFLIEHAEVSSLPIETSSSRESIIKDCSSIITSLETLSQNLVEDLEKIDSKIVTEKTKDTTAGKMGQFAADFIYYGPKFAKMQKKVTTMELNMEDLHFAAGQEGLEGEKKAALKDKATQMKAAIKKLQLSIDEKAKERGPWVQKTLSAAKIDGQLAVLKHISGMTDDPNDQRTLKERMQDLEKRKQEELEALKELKNKNADDPEVKKHEAEKAAKKKDAVDAKGKEVKESYTYEEILAEMESLDLPIEEAELIEENKFMDWLIYARRYRKLQQKINTMKMNAYDLGFAAANLGRSAENADKKVALNDKKRMLDDQIDELQSLLYKKIGERGPYVKKVVDKTRIEGQIEMVKHMSGLSTDSAEKRSLAQRMKDLKSREQEEAAAMAEYEKQAKADATDAKSDDELLRLKATLDDARETLKKIDKTQDPIAYAQADLEVAQADLNYKVEKGDRDGVSAAQEKVAKKQEAVKNSQQAVANQNQTTNQGSDQQHATDTESTPAPAEPANPATKLEANIAQYDSNIRTEMARIIKLESDVKTATEEKSKATSEAQRKSYEDKIVNLKAEIANSRADIEQMKAEKAKLVKQTVTREGLIVRAEELGLTELAESIASKEDWMLDGTKLYKVFEAEIVKAESIRTLNESRYTATSIKDRMNKLV